jgi:hypothetical protein
MDITIIVMWLGFILAAYSVVGNDVIQTLGTFLTSNETRLPWWVLWIYAGGILSVVLVIGFFDPFDYGYKYGVAYGRLEKFIMPTVYNWYYLLPPLVLLIITRLGIPVSTTFMILTLFSLQDIPNELPQMMGSVFNTEEQLGGMINKSLMGYIIAFIAASLIYLGITRLFEKRFIDNPIKDNRRIYWTIAQWCSTGFLWSQWLTQDLANIFIYLRGGENMSAFHFLISLGVLLGLLAYIFYRRGGAVQEIVRAKTNTADIRSATFVDFIYGIILYLFKYDAIGLWGGQLPMSTTWVFIGLLAGREIAIRFRIEGGVKRNIAKMVFSDLGKVFMGLVVSVVLVFIIKLIAG